jgi:hypothetical protein
MTASQLCASRMICTCGVPTSSTTVCRTPSLAQALAEARQEREHALVGIGETRLVARALEPGGADRDGLGAGDRRLVEHAQSHELGVELTRESMASLTAFSALGDPSMATRTLRIIGSRTGGR